MLTVGDIKKVLDEYPDNLEVYGRDLVDGHFLITKPITEIIAESTYYPTEKKTKIVFLCDPSDG